MIRLLNARAFALGIAMILPVSGWASDVNFSQKPLMAGGGVDPNLMFILDDSGSMRWGYMPDDLYGKVNFNGNCYERSGYAGVSPYRCRITGNRFLASSYLNKVYYNPNTTYDPPLSADGKTMAPANFFAAPVNGYSSSGNVDLSSDYRALMDPYSHWGGGFAVTENGWGTEPAFYFQFSGSAWCKNNPHNDSCYTKVVVGESERQNFANWFSYYRTREMSAKAGIGTVFANSALRNDFRLGWGRINKGKSDIDDAAGIRAVVEGVRPYEDVKNNFISWLYGQNANGSTPLQRALEGAGQYYENSKRAWIDDPSVASGVARECRISATMLMTDGYYNTGSSFDPDLNSYADDSNGPVHENSAGAKGQYKAVAPFSDGYTGRVSLADIAAYYWKRDLRSDIPNFVPTIDPTDDGKRKTLGNPAFWQNMMTFGIGFGVEGTVSREDAIDAALDGTSVNWWGGNTNEDKINDLLHASVNGRGDFFSAGDPETFRTELGNLLGQFLDSSGSATGLDFNVATIESEGALVFSSSFESNGWTGDIQAKTFKKGSDGLPTEATGTDNKGWSAQQLLDNVVPDERVILTWDGSQGQPFRWKNLTTDQKADLNTGTPSLGEDRLDYLRGKRRADMDSADAPYFRQRSHLLGTIVNSTPRFVGQPDSGWPNNLPNASKYSVFYNDNLERDPVVYVGSNDGMLHGFKATDSDDDGGKEVLAYVPSFVFSSEADKGLHQLTKPEYDHRFYVDLNLEVVDVYTGGRNDNGNISNKEEWRTVLIGGARAGAKGIFALDVTDPDGFSEADAGKHVLWEFTEDDDERLGFLVEPPEIALRDWGGAKGVRWTVFLSNGYNSSTASTGFFMLDLEAGMDGWSSGDYEYVEFEKGSGLSPLAVIDTGEDYIADRVYAGDRDGNMWVADVSEGAKSKLYSGPYFKAGQPITAAPAVALSVDSGNDPDLMILFGTGQYLEAKDNGTTDTQYFYAVHETSGPAGDPVLPPLTASDLEAVNLTTSGSTRKILETEPRIDYTKDRGWYIPLPTSGERIVNYPIIRGEYVYVNTIIPGSNPCLGGGDGWIMGMEIVRAKGASPIYKAFKKLDDDGAGIKVQSTPSQLSIWGSLLTFGTGLGGAGFEELDPFTDVLGRRGWREITE